ncbi:tetrachloroethene dehalogenase [uncultured Shewanella sp.]|uniref:tetrachloroethene dehalogenase n=1 Tax=Shewanella atlantica TaxID=271099 RepID=UPI002614881F|nr:tetrachloroethene dehalogenase [uncultured Shewanella sp.]
MIWLQWYLMGMMTLAAFIGYRELEKHFRLDWKANLGLLAAFCSYWLCFGWSWASFVEGETQSGAMGLIMFGLSGVIFTAITWRKFISPHRLFNK